MSKFRLYTFNLFPPDMDKLTKLADEDRTTITALVRKAVAQYVYRRNK